MEPTTAMAIASFVYSAYSSLSKSSSPDPLDALVKMLAEMNKKLNVINEKLTIIYQQLDKMPEQVEYKRRVNDLKVASDGIVTLYKKYHAAIVRERSEKKAKSYIIENYSSDVKLYIQLLRGSRSVLQEGTDALTVALLANAAQYDYELCQLVDYEEDDIKIEQKTYLDYLTNVIWHKESSLDAQIKATEAKLNSVVSDSFVVNWKILVGIIAPGAGNITIFEERQIIHLHLPTFEQLVLDDSKKLIVKTLSSFGYFDFKSFSKIIGYEKNAEYEKNPSKYSKTVFSMKKKVGYRKEKRPLILQNEHLENKEIKEYIKRQSTAYDNALNELLVLCSSHNLAVNTVKYINLRIQ